MSFSRENITWPSKNGTWSIGFYETLWVGSEADGYDPEWDVEYGDEFSWCSTGHATEAAAHASWKGVNPGGGIIVTEYDPEQCDALDAKAERCKAKMREDERELRRLSRLRY